MNKYFITLDNHLFCGMGTNYVAIAENEEELLPLADLWAYDNFCDLGGMDDYDEDSEDNEYTIEELDEAPYATIVEYNEETHGKWEWFELIYDGTKK